MTSNLTQPLQEGNKTQQNEEAFKSEIKSLPTKIILNRSALDYAPSISELEKTELFIEL